MDPKGKTWNRLRASTGQPNFIEDEIYWPFDSEDIEFDEVIEEK